MSLREDQFYRYQKSFIPFIAGIRNQILDDACEVRKGTEVSISIDGRWSSRRQAMEGTITCFDAETKQIIDVQHISEFPFVSHWLN